MRLMDDPFQLVPDWDQIPNVDTCLEIRVQRYDESHESSSYRQYNRCIP
jgi:hypothetical protein